MEDNQNTNPQAGAGDAVTYTHEELAALIQSETDKRVTQALQTAEKKKAKEIEQAKKLAGLSAQEQYELQLKEKEDLLTERENKLTLLENKNATVAILNEKNIPIEFAEIINDLDAETINSRIKTLEKVWKDALKKSIENKLPDTTPKGNKSSDNKEMTKDSFKKLSLSEQQKLYHQDRDLYNTLTK